MHRKIVGTILPARVGHLSSNAHAERMPLVSVAAPTKKPSSLKRDEGG